ncbi:hypothetical protein TNIN_368981 [Trichonephila inaurata madagascariensis]|uniref:C2H2-type domain-containing protein n=1 Tax=Trichonephila inaurata madagascariensis TaxID=2747483 RepID=A0A8X6X2Z1_9ARAC|nr:hypothetical protein TNIN_368981 [Trichonephila inaurata madagascariensis]
MDDKCNKPSAVNTELQGSVQEEAVDLSTGGDCRKACDSVLGMNSQHNDLRSENFHSRSEDLLLSGISLFDPKAKFSALQSDHLDANVQKNSESKSESNELRKNFKLVSGLKYNRMNTKEKSFQCDVCEKKLSSKQNLARHKHLHTGTPPYLCSVCGKGFRQYANFKEHMRRHTGEKPFRCNVCQKCFSGSSNLTVHIRTHTKEKPFQCPLCKNKFSQSNNLKRHIRKHNG